MDTQAGKDKILAEALEAFKKNNYNGIALLPTGSGKGRLMIEIAKILKPKSILYLCNTTLLRDQMFIDELIKWDAKYLISIIDFQCYQTAYKWKDKHYGLLLGDEFDAAITDKYSKVMDNNTFDHKVLVSATLDDEKKRKARKIAPIIYEKHTQELINEKVLNNIQFYFINYDLSSKENYWYLEYNKQFKVLLNQPQTKLTKFRLEKLQIKRKQFLSSLKTSENVTKWLLSTLKPANEKVLIFCGLSSQADKVCEHSYHSNNNNIVAYEKFKKGLIKEIAVVDKVTRGENIVGVKNIIHESIGKSKTKLTQKDGRGMRLDVDDTLNVFFLIPHFMHPFWGKKPSIVKEWVFSCLEGLDYKHAKYIDFKP